MSGSESGMGTTISNPLDWNVIAGDHAKKGNWTGAIECYTKGLEMNPQNPSFYYSSRGAAYVQVKKFEKALEDANKCLSMRPNWSYAYTMKMYILELKKRFYDLWLVCEEGVRHCLLKDDGTPAKYPPPKGMAEGTVKIFPDPLLVQTLGNILVRNEEMRSKLHQIVKKYGKRLVKFAMKDTQADQFNLTIGANLLKSILHLPFESIRAASNDDDKKKLEKEWSMSYHTIFDYICDTSDLVAGSYQKRNLFEYAIETHNESIASFDEFLKHAIKDSPYQNHQNRTTLVNVNVKTVVNCGRAHYGLGEIYLLTGRFDLVVDHMKSAIKCFRYSNIEEHKAQLLKKANKVLEIALEQVKKKGKNPKGEREKTHTRKKSTKNKTKKNKKNKKNKKKSPQEKKRAEEEISAILKSINETNTSKKKKKRKKRKKKSRKKRKKKQKHMTTSNSQKPENDLKLPEKAAILQEPEQDVGIDDDDDDDDDFFFEDDPYKTLSSVKGKNQKARFSFRDGKRWVYKFRLCPHCKAINLRGKIGSNKIKRCKHTQCSKCSRWYCVPSPKDAKIAYGDTKWGCGSGERNAFEKCVVINREGFMGGDFMFPKQTQENERMWFVGY